MHIQLNGKRFELNRESISLAEFLLWQGIDSFTGKVAVALNEKVIPRGEWISTQVHKGDRIEIIHAVQGG